MAGTCPRCGIALAAARYGGVDVEVCARCGGRWLDPEHLKTILDEVEPPEAASAVQAVPRRAKEGLPCPSCGGGLEPFNYAGDSGIVLDRCPACGRIWMDAGELEQVRAAVEASRRGVEHDAKRFSGALHEVEVREDAIEQQSVEATPLPSMNPIPIRTGNEKAGP